jgi:two-component system, OmpR family, response regulator MprA
MLSGDRSSKSGRVLVVDDHDDARELLKEVLEMHGFEVETASNGASALETVRRAPFDVVLLDIMMPRMDGLRVCQAMKSYPATAAVPVIFLTASSDPGLSAQALKVGACDLLRRPVEAAEIVRRVRAQLHRPAAQREPSSHRTTTS